MGGNGAEVAGGFAVVGGCFGGSLTTGSSALATLVVEQEMVVTKIVGVIKPSKKVNLLKRITFFFRGAKIIIFSWLL